MGTTTLLVLRDRLAEAIEGADYIEVAVTTAIAASTSIVSTNLNSYDAGEPDYFNGRWVYIIDQANIGVYRQIADYATSGGIITVRGANLATDGSNLANIRITRYHPLLYLNALNNAIRETYPNLLRYKDDQTLITGNILPNGHFEDQATSGTPDKYAYTNAAGSSIATAGLYRGAATSIKVTASADNGYMYITSDTYPRLLDLMGHIITVKVWAYPEVANSAAIVIYTKKADLTAQTLTSTTTCPITEWTQLKLVDQALNDDLVDVQIRFKVASSTKYTYFDDARVTGKDLYEYLLPTDLVSGHIRRVQVQTSGHSDDACDDLYPTNWEDVYGSGTITDGTDKFLQLPHIYTPNRRIRLIGDYPMSVLSADTDTIYTSEARPVNLLLKYAEYKFYEAQANTVSGADVGRYKVARDEALREYYRLLSFSKMSREPMLMNIRTY